MNCRPLLKNEFGPVEDRPAKQTLTTPSGKKGEFPVDGFSKHWLVEGVDEFGHIQQHEGEIAAHESERVGLINTLVA